MVNSSCSTLCRFLIIMICSLFAFPDQRAHGEPTSKSADPDPVAGGWRLDGANFEFTIRSDGSVEGTGKKGVWRKADGKPNTYSIKWEGAAAEQLLLLEPAGNVLTGTNAAGKPLKMTRTRAASTIPNEFAGMVLNEDWLTQKSEKRLEHLKGLRELAEALLGPTERGKEQPPKVIWGPFTWLMPYAEAKKHLPSGLGQEAEEAVSTVCFPKNSLKLVRFSGKWADPFFGLPILEIRPAGQTKRIGPGMQPNQVVFDTLYLMLDVKRQVVGVQLADRNVDISPRPMPYPAMEVVLENSGLYSDYLHLAYPGALQALIDVDADVRHREALIILQPAKQKADLHWYLPAPLAGRILDVADFLEKGTPPTYRETLPRPGK